jgi:integrase
MPAKQPPEIDSARQLELFDEALDESQPIEAEPLVMNERRRGSSADVEAPPAKPAGPSETGGERTHANADRVVMRELEEALGAARAAGDNRPAYVVLGSYLGEPGAPSTPLRAHGVSLQQARDGWLRRLETQQKSESTLVGYRVAIDDLLEWSETNGRDVLTEAAIVDYLHSYQERAQPAEASYYRRFVLLRRFVRWVCRRDGVPDPFLDLDAPPKPRQERDWLTPEEFRRLLDAAGRPERNLPGLAERDRLVLLALVTTGLRRSELCALEWRDLELGGREPSLLVRCGKGSKSRRQPLPASLACELGRLRAARQPEPTDPVFCGLEGGRLQETILADIIRRAAKRAGIEKHVTAHTLRHTAATWLRQELGDTRLVAE